ncbi:MAG: hypothetical protein GY851_05650 [bacterium]|nr:hypothetical protein [bacterium]
MKHHNRHGKEGVALLTVSLFIMLSVLILGALSIRVVTQKRHVDQYVLYKRCFQGLHSGSVQGVAGIENGTGGNVGLGSWTAPTPDPGEELESIVLPTFESDGVAPVQIPSMPEIEYMSFTQDWAADGFDNNGDGNVDDGSEVGMFTVYTLARNGPVERRCESILESHDVNVWNNAIFAGAGHVSGAVQGNCSIHGSVHILGDVIPEGGDVIVVLDLMGASLIHNNYGIGPGPGPALPDRLRDSVPRMPQTYVDGELVDTLNANLRVKNGLVSVNSASEIGEANIPGNPQKEFMDATFNEDGWTGTRTNDDGDRGDPTVVYSDNGWDYGYDLGDRVSLPLLSDDWRWPALLRKWELGYDYNPVPGSPEPSPDGDNYLHAEFFSDVLSDGAPYAGDVLIENDTDFYLNLTRPADPDPANRVKPEPSTLTSGDDYLYYNSATRVLEINGQIEIDGEFKIAVGKKGKSNPEIYYTGRAAILAHDDVTIDTSLFTCNNGDPNDYVNSFPANNCLGVMTATDMVVGESSQLDLMGAFYAQQSITSSKQTVVMGTFVAEWFDMGSQVPDIFQVPELTDVRIVKGEDNGFAPSGQVGKAKHQVDDVGRGVAFGVQAGQVGPEIVGRALPAVLRLADHMVFQHQHTTQWVGRQGGGWRHGGGVCGWGSRGRFWGIGLGGSRRGGRGGGVSGLGCGGWRRGIGWDRGVWLGGLGRGCRGCGLGGDW